MSGNTIPSKTEVDDVIDQCNQAEIEGSRWPGMTYEQGVQAALIWVQGDGGNPLTD